MTALTAIRVVRHEVADYLDHAEEQRCILCGARMIGGKGWASATFASAIGPTFPDGAVSEVIAVTTGERLIVAAGYPVVVDAAVIACCADLEPFAGLTLEGDPCLALD